jgi:hypothetical protein
MGGGQQEGRGFWARQRVSGMPPLSLSNCFAVLSVDEVYKSNSISSTDSIVDNSQAVPSPPPLCLHV